MHAVVIRKDRLAEDPGLANTIYESFCKAKDAAVKQYEHLRIFNNMDTMFPWLSRLMKTIASYWEMTGGPTGLKPIVKLWKPSFAVTSNKASGAPLQDRRHLRSRVVVHVIPRCMPNVIDRERSRDMKIVGLEEHFVVPEVL